MILIITRNSVYTLDEDKKQYMRKNTNPMIVGGTALRSDNLTYEEWRPYVSWEKTDRNTVLIHYPESSCPHHRGPDCTNRHWLETSPVRDIQNFGNKTFLEDSGIVPDTSAIRTFIEED